MARAGQQVPRRSAAGAWRLRNPASWHTKCIGKHTLVVRIRTSLARVTLTRAAGAGSACWRGLALVQPLPHQQKISKRDCLEISVDVAGDSGAPPRPHNDTRTR